RGDRNTPLTVEVTDGELRIRVGLSTLKHCAEHNPLFRDSRLQEIKDVYCKVVDEAALGEDVARELKREREDGTTPVHLLLDQAMFDAWEDGSIAFEEP